MGVCIFGQGDCGNESKSEINVLNENINEVVTSVMATFNQDTDVTVSTTSVFEVGPCAKLNCDGGVSFNNDTKQTTQVFSEINAQQLTDLSNKITEEVTNKLKQELEQSNSWLATGKNTAEAITNVENILKSSMETTVSTSINNTISINASSSNNFQFNGQVESEGPCSLSSQQIIETISSNISSSIIDTLLKNDISRDILTDASIAIKQENKGIAELVESLINALLTGFLAPFLPFIGIFLLVVVGGFVMVILKNLMGGGGGGDDYDDYDGRGGGDYYDDEYGFSSIFFR